MIVNGRRGSALVLVLALGDLRTHNLATPQDSLSVGAVLTFESIDISVGPIFELSKLKPLLQDI